MLTLDDVDYLRIKKAGVDARNLVEDPAFVDTFNTQLQELLLKWIDSEVYDADHREGIWHRVHALLAITNDLEQKVQEMSALASQEEVRHNSGYSEERHADADPV